MQPTLGLRATLTRHSKGGDMFSSDLDTFRFLTRERSERLMREAQAQRLAKEARGVKGNRCCGGSYSTLGAATAAPAED
jgi:hypothetical protein